MKAILALGALIILALVAFNQTAGPSIDPNTPVRVLNADPIKVLLPAEPDSKAISGYVYAELSDVARNSTGIVEEDLRAMSSDTSLMSWIADSGATRFSTNAAAALAYPLYRVRVSPELVTITTATIELLPQYWSIGTSIAHEDGHATVNRLIAEHCGPIIVERLATDGRRGGSLAQAIEDRLYDLGNVAHNTYHGMVNGSSSPAFARAARLSAEAVAEDGC